MTNGRKAGRGILHSGTTKPREGGTWSTLVADILHGEPQSPSPRSAWASSFSPSGRRGRCFRLLYSPLRRWLIVSAARTLLSWSVPPKATRRTQHDFPPLLRASGFPTMADALRLLLPLRGTLTFRSSPSADDVAADLSLSFSASSHVEKSNREQSSRVRQRGVRGPV